MRIPDGYVIAPYPKRRLSTCSDGSIHEVIHDPAQSPTLSPAHSPVHSKPVIAADSVELDVTDDDPSSLKVEVNKFKKVWLFLFGVWLETVDMVIGWMEASSADYVHVVNQLRRARYQSVQDTMVTHDTTRETIPFAAAPHDGVDVVTYGTTSEAQTATVKRLSSSPPPAQPPPSAAPFDRSGDALITALHVAPTEFAEQQAEEVESRLGEVSRKYTERPTRLLVAAYYWMLSHFEYVVFFFIILAILETGTVPGYIYAIVLFLWGLLSIPWPSRRFWMTLMFYTVLVLMIKYIYLFILVTFFQDSSAQSFVWIFGLQQGQSYFSNAIFNMLLLMTLIFHRSLLKVCYHKIISPSLSLPPHPSPLPPSLRPSLSLPPSFPLSIFSPSLYCTPLPHCSFTMYFLKCGGSNMDYGRQPTFLWKPRASCKCCPK